MAREMAAFTGIVDIGMVLKDNGTAFVRRVNGLYNHFFE